MQMRVLGVVLGGMFAVLASASVRAADDKPWQYQPDFDYQGSANAKWQEQGVTLPAYPGTSGLIPLQVDNAHFDYFVDPESVSVGTHDGVVRYTLVAQSSDGATNVFYEGIRCGSPGMYKTYAFGTGKGPFQSMTGADWRPIRPKIADGFRFTLYRYYFCSGTGVAGNAKALVNRLKYQTDPSDPRSEN
jgi:hypothetical protein